MGNQVQSVSAEELADLSRQCTSLHEDWQRFYHLAASPPNGEAAQQQLTFIQLQSRFSCDYPILSHWRKANFGLAGAISKLVANAGTLEAFAREARAGDGPLIREWHTVNDAIAKVRKLLDGARDMARAGKPIALPKEIAATVARDPWPIRAWANKGAIACGALVVCGVVFLIAQPFLMETSLFEWVDRSYTAWQLRNGLPGVPLEMMNEP